MTIEKKRGEFVVTFRNISFVHADRLIALKMASMEAFR